MKEVISCSRRTDIPWWYYDWLQNVLKEGEVTLTNGFSGKEYTIDLSPDKVHTIVLWSKNYEHVLNNTGLLKNYNLYFQFTLNGYSKVFEPKTPHIDKMVDQMNALAGSYSPEQINWRFDPIVLSKDGELNATEKVGHARLNMFEQLCHKFSNFGIKRCTISFMDLYDKVKTRLDNKNVDYQDLDDRLKILFTERLVDIASYYNIQLYSCSQPIIENVDGIKKGHCIDGDLLASLSGEKASKANDSSQRKACGCTKSKDIGAYSKKCKGSCLYCYANPVE